jgi:hypothetical protein
MSDYISIVKWMEGLKLVAEKIVQLLWDMRPDHKCHEHTRATAKVCVGLSQVPISQNAPSMQMLTIG